VSRVLTVVDVPRDHGPVGQERSNGTRSATASAASRGSASGRRPLQAQLPPTDVQPWASRLTALQRTAGNRALVAGLTPNSLIVGIPTIQRSVDEDAEALSDAIEGLGTDEATVFRVLGANQGNSALAAAYRRRTGRSLESDLRGDLSGAELNRALRLYFGHSSTVWDAAIRLKGAMEGAGTDEDTVLEVLRAQTTATARASLRDAYRDATRRSLRGDIRGDFSGDELREAMLAYEHGPLTPDLRDAVALREAMAGAGTDEASVYRILRARATPGALEPLKAAYLRLTRRTLEGDVREDFSGDELTEALRLLGMGTFSNRITQDMFEGGTTVVRGRFDWRFESGQMQIHVRVHFEPEEGVTVPLTTWQSQIDSVWNQYALVEPGGQSIPIQMSLVNAGGGKRIRVVQNSNPGTYAPPDRANAGKWYPVMPPDTAPHEFGHLIGLPDEYQRTHPDFQSITGGVPTGPTNTSGKSNAAIAAELNTALTDAQANQRAAKATTVLTNAGLIVGGAPQQGDFAQAVMAAYDAAFSPSLQDTLIALPRAGRWTLQSVFSYASGTVMGNPGVVPHEHPVASRHLRNFASIASSRFPTFTWTTGPR
jgi:hypothetical protein